MTTMRRTDMSVIGEMLDKLNADLPIAIEADALREWGSAMAALAEYQAQRHEAIQVGDEISSL